MPEMIVITMAVLSLLMTLFIVRFTMASLKAGKILEVIIDDRFSYYKDICTLRPSSTFPVDHKIFMKAMHSGVRGDHAVYSLVERCKEYTWRKALFLKTDHIWTNRERFVLGIKQEMVFHPSFMVLMRKPGKIRPGYLVPKGKVGWPTTYFPF